MDNKALYQFTRRVLENPEDDTVRLVFADWLDENDQSARAEFIRTQIEIAKHPGRCDAFMYSCHELFSSYADTAASGCDKCKAYAGLKIRERELLRADQNWGPSGGNLYTEEVTSVPTIEIYAFRFRKGWIDKAWMNTEKFVGHAEVQFSWHPITEVVLVDRKAPSWTMVNADDRTPTGSSWWHDVGVCQILPFDGYLHHLPNSLFVHLDEKDFISQPNPKSKFYTNRHTATAALSRACVRYGRTQNRLPEIFPV